eukprot:5297127-Prymnesium_polylepis.1
MTYAVTAWPPDRPRGVVVGETTHVPVCPWQALLSLAAERCRRMCPKPGLDLGGCTVTARLYVWYYSASHTHTVWAARTPSGLWPMMSRVAVSDATRALRCPGWHEI